MTDPPDQFLGLPGAGVERADALILTVPLERTVCYGTGTADAPGAILRASRHIEVFDEVTGTDFEHFPRLETLGTELPPGGSVEEALEAIERRVRELPGRFLLALGGEHTITFPLVSALVPDPSRLTLVQIDAHADLADTLEGRRWSHGTVMRRLFERGIRLFQVGIRSLSREEHELAEASERITTYYGHMLPERRDDLLRDLAALTGPVYLSLDVDGLDPSVVPSTGTPMPDGLSWRQALEVVEAVTGNPKVLVVGADVVEFVPSPAPPGCDVVAAKLAYRLLAHWAAAAGRRRADSAHDRRSPGTEARPA